MHTYIVLYTVFINYFDLELQRVKINWVLVNCEIPNDAYNVNDLRILYPDYGVKWMFFPDGDGKPSIILLDGNSTNEVSARSRSALEEFIHFNLYTRKNTNESYRLELNDVQNLQQSNIDLKKKTKFVTHGWLSSGDGVFCQSVKNAYLKTQDVNIIVVDWGKHSTNYNYFIPMLSTVEVGRQVSKMVTFLGNQGAQLSDIHLIGHSLGAQISGNAGALITKGRVGRVTGLDPALPGFIFINDKENRLDNSDADFIDIIHTCGGVLGYGSSAGHADFYPNGGTPSQPGCCCLAEFVEGCSHGRSWEYYIESILCPGTFMSKKCDSWSNYKENKCNDSELVDMGDPTPTTTRGDYYLYTNERTPYGLDKVSENCFLE